MAFSSRLLSKSKQLCGSSVILQQQNAVPVRYFAKEAASQALKGDEMLKNIFLDVKKKFETALGILRKEKITIAPEDPAAVSHYAKFRRHDDGYLLRGLIDELGAEAMMMDALEKVENELKKPLMRNDKKGMALLTAEFAKINQKLGIRKEDLPKYEEQLELKIAKAQLEELKKDALEAMETQKKRYIIYALLTIAIVILFISLHFIYVGVALSQEVKDRIGEEFKDEQMVDVKSLDIRNFL
ncbi:hypothetical protein JRO89_XS08G0039500 [Xanthoceras sorbifolium]|uniref:Uncharacterized protein n=1 Tax=Xanthoceras sorbifolium TaxID=99658 RepID=A0ABQ8HNJ5_9ROSI|nr:hypothetical protein JRO89_XS08G0039500 [Xanthoceras sorbifolium]